MAFSDCGSQEMDDDSEYVSAEDETGGIWQDVREQIAAVLNSHDEVSVTNALTLNKEMQSRLAEVRQRLQQILRIVQDRYKVNEERLRRNLKRNNDTGVGIRGAYLKGGTFYFKGNMFFKDENCSNCPNNVDYLRRSAAGEMFPMDHELCGRHVWSLVDKAGIVQAIKEQVIEHMADYTPKHCMNETAVRHTRDVAVCSEKLVSLLGRVDERFRIDWMQVAAHNLQHRHSAGSCEAMWLMYLHPTLSRDTWSAAENDALLAAARTHNFQNWEAIAAAVGKRSPYQCFVQYATCVCRSLPNRWRKWKKQDDERLRQLVERYTINGVIKWSPIASHFPHKPKSSIVQRYTDFLDPRISRGNFTPEEDLLLLAAVEEYGTKFSCFPRTVFPNRSLTQLRSRYYNTLRNRHQYTAWSLADDQRLMAFVSANGPSAWLHCSEALGGNHSRTSCRTRYFTLQGMLANRPEARLEDLPRRATRYVDSDITPQNWLEKVMELRANPEEFKQPKRSKAVAIRKRKSPRKTKKQMKAEARILLKEQRAAAALKASGSATSVVKSRRKPIYVERLRPVELRLYHFYKFAYHFRLGVDVCPAPLPSSRALSAVVQMLHFVAPEKPYVHDYNLPMALHTRTRHALHRAVGRVAAELAGIHLPPSWPTAMAFRALCIQAAGTPLDGCSAEQTTNDSHAALRLFRARLSALLHHTTLLSRLKPAAIARLHPRQLSIAAVSPHKDDTLSQNECVKVEVLCEPDVRPVARACKRKRSAKRSSGKGAKLLARKDECVDVEFKLEN